MKKIDLAVLLLFSVICCMATPKTIKFEDDAAFHISFDDQTVEADISGGGEIPVLVMGKPSFRNGIAAKALLCGKNGAKVRFPRKNNLNFDRSGTIVFFYKGENWKKTASGPRVFFWAIESTQGYIGLQLANDPKNLCPCQRQIHAMFLYGKKIPQKVFTTNPDGEAGCEKWHMIAYSWSPGQLRINFDRAPGKTFPLSFDMSEDDFPDQTFSIGSNCDWEYLLDEFTVYKRRLSDAEIIEIYDAVLAKGNTKTMSEIL